MIKKFSAIIASVSAFFASIFEGLFSRQRLLELYPEDREILGRALEHQPEMLTRLRGVAPIPVPEKHSKLLPGIDRKSLNVGERARLVNNYAIFLSQALEDENIFKKNTEDYLLTHEGLLYKTYCTRCLANHNGSKTDECKLCTKERMDAVEVAVLRHTGSTFRIV